MGTYRISIFMSFHTEMNYRNKVGSLRLRNCGNDGTLVCHAGAFECLARASHVSRGGSSVALVSRADSRARPTVGGWWNFFLIPHTSHVCLISRIPNLPSSAFPTYSRDRDPCGCSCSDCGCLDSLPLCFEIESRVRLFSGNLL